MSLAILESGIGIAYLVPHNGLFYGSKVLKGRQQNVTPLRTADIVDKLSQLAAEGHKNLIFVFDTFCSKKQVSVSSIYQEECTKRDGAG